MKKIYSFLLFTHIVFVTVIAQEIRRVDFQRTDNDKIIITYELINLLFYHSLDIDLYYSIDGGTVHGPLKYVSGDVGKNIKGEGIKQIVWDVFKETHELEGVIVFYVEGHITTLNRDRKLYLSYYGGSFSNIGISIGKINQSSFYFSAKMNDMFINSNTMRNHEFSDYREASNSIFEFDNNSFYRRISLSTGFNFQLNLNLHLFIGFGAGSYDGLWKYNEYNSNDDLVNKGHVLIEDYRFRGFEAEIGLRYLIANRLLLTGGLNALLNFNPLSEIVFGVGWVF